MITPARRHIHGNGGAAWWTSPSRPARATVISISQPARNWPKAPARRMSFGLNRHSGKTSATARHRQHHLTQRPTRLTGHHDHESNAGNGGAGTSHAGSRGVHNKDIDGLLGHGALNPRVSERL